MRTLVILALTLATFGRPAPQVPPAAAPKSVDGGRATALLESIKSGLAEPASAARNAKLEGLVDQLDRLPATGTFDQRFTAHQRMAIAYYHDDDAAGIVKHSTWIVDAAKTCAPDQRKQYASTIVNAYLNLAQAWSAEGETARAIALLRGAPASLPEIPTIARSVKPDLERLEIVGTAAAPIAAPRWLNMPAGTTTLDLKGKVTLLEFSAHWCVPCKKSYPAVNRLRHAFGVQEFRVVMDTEFYGFFDRETQIAPAMELDRDRAYFAEAGLDVPIAINDEAAAQENPNAGHYKVGGLPQIQIIDRHGTIRFVMVGYTDQAEAALTKIVGDLIKEK